MFRAIWSKSLRDYRVAILGWGIAMGLLMTVGLATATPDVLAAWASLVPLFRFLGDPYAVQTPTGYVTFRYLGTVLPVMLSLWPILAGARMVALLLSQLTTSRRTAAGAASGVLILSLLLIISGRELNGSWVQYLSPFYYYNLNRPLIVGLSGSAGAVVLLVGLSILCAALSLMLFVRRDIGGLLFSWQRKTENGERSLSRAEHALSTRSVGLHTLSVQGWSSFWWLFGIVLFCVYCLLLVPGLQKAFYKLVQETPWLVITIGALLLNLNVDQGRVLAASFSMLPPALITLGLVYALAGRLRYTPVLVILTAYLVLAFLEENLEGNIQFPSWLLSLSIFHLYGNPIFVGMNWSNFLGMMGVAVVLLIVGVVQFRAADIQLG